MIILLHTVQMSCYTNYFTYGFIYLPQKLAVPLFFLISSYFFWMAINKAENIGKIFVKYIGRWIICYLFWSFIHLRFYHFDWYYPTAGVLWFFYALTLGNIIVFLLTRIIKNKYVLTGYATIIIIFMALADGWYGKSITIPIIQYLVINYYNIFKTLLSGFTYGILFSIIAYFLAGIDLSKINFKLTKHIFITIILFVIYSIEGYYAYVNSLPREYAFYFFITPLCISIFTLLLRINIKVSYANCLGKISALMYYIHIMIYYHWSGFYSGLFINKSELVKDLHGFLYVYVFTTWLSFIIYLLSRKVKILRKLF